MALNRLLKFAKLDPSEEKNFRLLFLQSLLSGFGISFFFVVVNAFFIKKVSFTNVPFAYMLSGTFGYFLITLYKKLQKKTGVINSYISSFIIYALTGIVLYLCRVFIKDTSDASVFIAYVGFVVVLPLSAMQTIGFSTVCLRIFNISQSKRLLALIGTGEIIASIIAYLLILLITKVLNVSVVPLLILSAITNLVAIFPLRKIYHHNKEKLDTIKFSATQTKMNMKFFLKDKFYQLIAIVTLFSVMVVYFSDYTYILSVKYIAAESDIEIAVIISVIFSVIKSGELTASLLSGNIIRSNGMKISLLLLPVILVISSLIGFSTSLIFGVPFFLVFFILINKWCERAIRKGVTIPSMKVVYQVTDPADRAQLQTSIDGTITQYTTIISGILLWVFSIVFKTKNVILFLEIMTFICIILYALWSWSNLALFNNYRIKIREYLHRFRHSATKVLIAEFEASTETGDKKQEIYHRHALLVQAMDSPLPLDLKTISEYISYYNPNIKITTRETSILKKVQSAYYSNENFFSRLLIIWYIALQDKETMINFVKEYYSISELQLRVQIIAMLNKADYKIRPEDNFFFTGLCQDIATDIMWVESSINDLSDSVDQSLIDALNDDLLTLRSLLFETLKVLYEQESIQVVQDIMNGKDQSLENRLFAIELLDNLLDTQMKKLLMPVIEDFSYNSRKEKLQKNILIYDLSATERLKEILMANFMTVSPHIKQMALEQYYKISEDKAILNAFAASYVENLNATASALLHSTDDKLYKAKINMVKTLNLEKEIALNTLSYFIKWGFFAKTKRKNNNSINEYLNKQTYQFNKGYIANIKQEDVELSVDMLGLALTYKIGQN